MANYDPRLWYGFNPQSFTLPSATSLGIGNTPPTLTYGPGTENIDLAIQKDFNIGSGERPKVLSFKLETFNLLNHFNPSNPNTTIAINCAPANGQCTAPSGISAYTSTTFGTITAAQVQSRHAAVTLRFRF